jgi:hypothetical protein
MALKESAVNSIVEFMRKASTLGMKNSSKALFEANLLSEIKTGLRNSKNENARHEFVSLLLNFIRIFKDIFPKYNDLLKLTDEDVEKDFYENIKHIQASRWISIDYKKVSCFTE